MNAKSNTIAYKSVFSRSDGEYHCQPAAMQTHTTNHQAKKYTISYLIAKYEDRDTDKQ